MKIMEFVRWLKQQGCDVKPAGNGSHHKVFRENRQSVVSVKRGELPKGTMYKILKDLELTEIFRDEDS
jgi:predicted RNA binding protein YcfA (HicA-like mRNA interferase family)